MKWWWRLRSWVTEPRMNYRLWRKWRQRPDLGTIVEDCRNELHTVVGFVGGDEDTLLFEDGHSASWMNCCDTAEEHMRRNDISDTE